MIAIDFETHLISENAPFPKPVCLSWYDGKDSGIFLGDDIEPFLKKILTTEKIIAHNATFECGVIWYHYPAVRKQLITALNAGKIICTKICEQIIDINRQQPIYQYSLAKLVAHYFDEDISHTKTEDAWRTNYDQLDGIPLKNWPKEAIDYAIEDSVYAYRIRQQQGSINQRVSVCSEVFLNLWGTKGFNIKQEHVEQLEQEIQAKLQPKYKLLIDRGVCTPVKNSHRPKNNMKFLREYVEKNIEAPMYTPKGTVRVDGEALHAYITKQPDDMLEAYLDVVKYDKIITAYISRLKGNKLIRASYSAVKSTGRTSSSASKLYPSVNIQQMPRGVPGVKWDVRNCFIARPGYKLVSIDYSNLELAATSHQLYKTFGRSKMRDAYNHGNEPTDMHSMFGAKLMSIDKKKHVDYETFKQHKKEKEYAYFRQLAKPLNLGFPGGIGYDTMRTLLYKSGVETKFNILHTDKHEYSLWKAVWRMKLKHPSLRVARVGKKEYAIVDDELVKLKNEMFKMYPELEEFLKEKHKQFIDGDNVKWVKNDFGEWEQEPMYKYNIYGFKRSWCTYTAFCNGYLMQTPAACGAKQMVIDISKKYMLHPKVNLLAFIHDEIIFEVLDDDEKYAIIEDISYQMIDSMQTVLSSVRIAVEAEMMDYWSKEGGEWSKMWWR